MILVTENRAMGAVEFFLNDDGIDKLIERLQHLKGGQDHLHLRAYGVRPELEASSPWPDVKIFNEVILTLVGD